MIDVLTENKQYMTITGSYLKFHNLKVWAREKENLKLPVYMPWRCLGDVVI